MVNSPSHGIFSYKLKVLEGGFTNHEASLSQVYLAFSVAISLVPNVKINDVEVEILHLVTLLCQSSHCP